MNDGAFNQGDLVYLLNDEKPYMGCFMVVTTPKDEDYLPTYTLISSLRMPGGVVVMDEVHPDHMQLLPERKARLIRDQFPPIVSNLEGDDSPQLPLETANAMEAEMGANANKKKRRVQMGGHVSAVTKNVPI